MPGTHLTGANASLPTTMINVVMGTEQEVSQCVQSALEYRTPLYYGSGTLDRCRSISFTATVPDVSSQLKTLL